MKKTQVVRPAITKKPAAKKSKKRGGQDHHRMVTAVVQSLSSLPPRILLDALTAQWSGSRIEAPHCLTTVLSFHPPPPPLQASWALLRSNSGSEHVHLRQAVETQLSSDDPCKIPDYIGGDGTIALSEVVHCSAAHLTTHLIHH